MKTTQITDGKVLVTDIPIKILLDIYVSNSLNIQRLRKENKMIVKEVLRRGGV